MWDFAFAVVDAVVENAVERCHKRTAPITTARGLCLVWSCWWSLCLCCKYIIKELGIIIIRHKSKWRLFFEIKFLRRSSFYQWITAGDQGAKKVSFTACHSGKLKVAFTSPILLQLAPKTFWWVELISQFFCNLNFSKKLSYPFGKLRKKFAIPVAKFTRLRQSDTTFFAPWVISPVAATFYQLWIIPIIWYLF